MALTHPGTPVYIPQGDGGGRLEFQGVVYPEYHAAVQARDAAYQNWHNAVDGNPALGIPRNEALRVFHEDVKRRTNNPSLREPRTPFWNAQATVLGNVGMPAANPALVNELKQAYAEHVGPEMEAFAAANKALHEHEILLYRAQIETLQNATTLQGLADEIFHANPELKQAMIRYYENRITQTQAVNHHLETYLQEIPRLRMAGGAAHSAPHQETPPPHETHPITPETPPRTGGGGGYYGGGYSAEPASEVASSAERTVERLEQQVEHAHGNRSALIATAAAAVGVGLLGAYFLTQKKQEKPAHTAMKTSTTQLGAVQSPGNDQQQWTSAIRTQSATPSLPITK